MTVEKVMDDLVERLAEERNEARALAMRLWDRGYVPTKKEETTIEGWEAQ